MTIARIPTGTRLVPPLLPLLLLVAAACGGSADRAADSVVAAESAAAASAAAAPAPAGASTAAGTATVDSASQGAFLDPNSATREQLTAVPGVTAPVADALIAARPLAGMSAVNKVLAAQVPDSAARQAIYSRVWMPLDLNTASADDILLIPGVGRRMQHEFEEYRPYKNMEQFRREIGKYVDKNEVARLERYVMIR